VPCAYRWSSSTPAGGHRAAATALAAPIQDAHPAWDVQPVQLMDVLDPQGRFLRLTGLRAEDDFDIEAERARLGLPLAKPVGLVMFGGQGSSAMLSIAKALHDRPLILMCAATRRWLRGCANGLRIRCTTWSASRPT
jgi:hypothetical protein